MSKKHTCFANSFTVLAVLSVRAASACGPTMSGSVEMYFSSLDPLSGLLTVVSRDVARRITISRVSIHDLRSPAPRRVPEEGVVV